MRRGGPGRNIVYVRSDKDTNFTDELDTDEGEFESVRMFENIGGKEVYFDEGTIKSISILSLQGCAWSLFFFTKSTGATTDMDDDTFLEYFEFDSLSGRRIRGSDFFRYAFTHLGVRYRDMDDTQRIHMELVNRGRLRKGAGAAGHVVVTIGMEIL